METQRRLKTFIGNYGGTRMGLVVTTSQKKAAEIARVSLYDFRNYWNDWVCSYQEDFKPDTFYTRPMNLHGKRERDSWIEGPGY